MQVCSLKILKNFSLISIFLPEDSFNFQAYWKSTLPPTQPNVAQLENAFKVAFSV